MWYFTWILGLGAALAFGIINVMWLEASYTFGELDESRIRERFSVRERRRSGVTLASEDARRRRANVRRILPDEPKPATLPQVVGAVFWSFFGVRRGKHMQRDAVTVKPLQVIVVGVLLAAVLVFALLALVRVILSYAS